MEKTWTRVLSSVISLPLLIIVAVSHQIVLSFSVFLLSLIGANEFYNAVEKTGHKPVRYVGFFACFSIFILGMLGMEDAIGSLSGFYNIVNIFAAGVFVIIFVVFSIVILSGNKYNLIDASLTVFGIVYVIFLFAFIVLTRNLDEGKFLIWFIFIGAFGTDTFAYIAGRAVGRHKLIPVISPNKTVEGSVGGTMGCIVLTFAYGVVAQNIGFLSSFPVYHLIILGLLNGIVSQIGDLAASAIKRYAGIKDYGNLMPGHGGVLDRFDSVLFTAPIVYFYFSFLISAG